VLPFTKNGVIGGVMLGLGRALGETMAVTFIIGNDKGDNEQDQTQFHQRRYVQAAFRFREFIGQRRGLMATIELQTTAALAESRRKMQAKRRLKNRIALTSLDRRPRYSAAASFR
jgi:ABC-type phosphate transport system permease subunit